MHQRRLMCIPSGGALSTEGALPNSGALGAEGAVAYQGAARQGAFGAQGGGQYPMSPPVNTPLIIRGTLALHFDTQEW
jgi:hypothetical protein